MSDENADLQAAVRAAYTDAVSYVDTELAPERATAMRMYNGDKFGLLAEEEGRSSVVLTELRDTILAMMPSLLRVFCSDTSKVFEFVPRRGNQVEQAALVTAYINDIVLAQDNPGFRVLHDAIKDALLFRFGAVKYWWDESVAITAETYTGLSMQQAKLVKNDDGGGGIGILEETIRVEFPDEDHGLDDVLMEHLHGLAKEGMPLPPPGMPIGPVPQPPVGAPPGEAPPVLPPADPNVIDQGGLMPHGAEVLVDLKVKRTRKTGIARVACVPPEELLVDRRARDIKESRYVGHRSLRTVAELVAMGFDREEVEQHAGGPEDFGVGSAEEEMFRNPSAFNRMDNGSTPDPTQRRVNYVEHYIQYGNDDGIAELRRVCTVGGDCKVLFDEIVPEIPFALFQIDPTPHTWCGQSIADQVGDLQVIRSSILRNTLDSLAQSIHPRTVVVEGMVNMEDVLNVEVGGIIRARNMGAVQPLETPFVGQSSLPMLAYLDSIKQGRTGITPASNLDPEALQSTTASAVSLVTDASGARLELIARVLAETGMKSLARGLLKLVHRHQDTARMVRLKEQFVEIDPTTWDAEMDVSIATGLGRDDSMQKMQMLMQVAAKQEQLLQMLGPMNPICGIEQWRNTVSDIAELAGFKNSERYFKPVTPQVAQMMQQSMGGQKQPSPEMLTAQANLALVQAQAQAELTKLDLQRQEMLLKDDRERDKAVMEFELKKAEIAGRYHAAVNDAAVQAEVNRERHTIAEVNKFAQHVMPGAQTAPPMPQPMPPQPEAQPPAPPQPSPF